MTSRFESERPYPESPVYGYFHEIENMTSGLRDRIFAINTLCEKVTGEPASDELLRQLVYEPATTEKLASLERLATYPIVVFGPIMERSIGPANAGVEYRRALSKLLLLSQGRHDEGCATSGPCLTAEEYKGERYSFCPVMDCVDYLSEGMTCYNPHGEEYLVDAWDVYSSVSTRAKALIDTSHRFKLVYQQYLNKYRSQFGADFFDEARPELSTEE